MKFNFIKILLMFNILNSSLVEAQILEICISHIRGNDGQICVAVFNSEEGFKNEKTCWEKYYPKKNLTDQTIRIKIQLKADWYGISVFDDKNMDGKMQYNFLGIPLEGYGFGNYEHRSIYKPTFSDFSFELKENQTREVEVIMKYL